MKKVYLKPEMLVVQLRHNRAMILLNSNTKMVQSVKTNNTLGPNPEDQLDMGDEDGNSWDDAM